MQTFRGFFDGKDRLVKKSTSFSTKTRFSRRKEYFTSEIVFYIGNLSFCIEILQKFGGFFDGKDRLLKKSTSFSSKTRFSRRKEYFTSEIVFYSGNLSFCIEILQTFRGFFDGKDRLVKKSTSFSTKTRFSRRKEYFTSEIVFYIGNLSFCIEILQKFGGFFDGKDRLLKKSTSFSSKTRFSRRKEYFISEIVFYSGILSFAEKNLQKFRVLFRGKDRFVIKIPVLTPKTRFSRRKESTLRI